MGTFLFDPFYGTIQANNLTNLHIVWANEKRPGCPKSSVITAFLNVTWGEEKIEVGKRTIVRVDSPFYCKAGHTFSAIYRKERRWGSSLPLNIKCVTARMLKYWGNTDIDNAYAYVLVEVIEIVEILSLVKGLSEVEVLNLRYSDKYELIPELDYIEYPWDRMKANDRNAENLFSIVEENQEDYGTVFIVYTDKKKVDHLVGLIMWDWWSFEISLGDHVIGLHQNCPCLPFNKEKERIIEECYYERSWKDDRRRNKKVGYTSYHRIKK